MVRVTGTEGRGESPLLRISISRGTRSPSRKSAPRAEMRRSCASGRAEAGVEERKARASAKSKLLQVHGLRIAG